MSKKAPDYELSDPELTGYIAASEANLRFPSFDPSVAFTLGTFLKSRFERLNPGPGAALYIQIRGFPARPGSPFVLFAAMAGEPGKLGAGIAYQIEGKARVVEHSGSATLGAKAFAAMMGWEVSKMGLGGSEYICNGGGFPIRVAGCSSPVGAVIVSGLPDVQDHQFIVDSLEEYLATLSSATA